MKIKIPKKDLKFKAFKSSGPGGQHRNKIESAMRVTHLPTGITAECTTHKSQHMNKRLAVQKLVEKLQQHFKPKVDKTRFNATKVIRTYNECKNFVKDHDTGDVHSFKDTFGKGKMDDVITQRSRKMLLKGEE